VATSGAQPGNSNAVKGKAFLAALRKVMAEFGEGEGVDGGLRKLARKLATAALDDGEPWAMQEIMNRFDGKPAQSVVLNGDDEGGPVRIQTIEIKAVDP